MIDDYAAELGNAANYVVRAPSNEGEHQTDQIKATTAFAFLIETQTTIQPAYNVALQEVARVRDDLPATSASTNGMLSRQAGRGGRLASMRMHFCMVCEMRANPTLMSVCLLSRK